MFSPDNDELAGAVIDKQGATSYVTTYNNEGYFGRAQYDYDGKYFASASSPPRCLVALPPVAPLG